MKKQNHKCRSISSLLYLYREGELTPAEKSKVDKHIEICSSCASVLGKLTKIESALQHYKTMPLPTTGKEDAINGTIRRVNNLKAQSTGMRPAQRYIKGQAKYKVLSNFDLLIPLLRPVLIGTVAALFCFLCFQQLRDILKISALEYRMQESGSAYSAMTINKNLGSDLLKLQQYESGRYNSYLPVPQSRADIKDIYNNISVLWHQLFSKKNEFIDHLLRQYPGLSTVNVEDGLSKEERAILSTEGRALLRELEQLIQEGK